MNVNDLFKKKLARKAKPGGLSQEQADAIEKEFLEAMDPIAEKATQYLRNFTLNGRRYSLLLPFSETHHDLPIEKMAYINKYKAYFVNEISKQVVDDLPY